MKKIIKGKIYDTDKATLIGCWDNNVSRSDFSFIEESLYRKRTGECFLHGFGMAATKYAKPTGGGGFSSGEEIFPLSWEEAREWAERNLSADVYEQAFGEVAEDASRITITLSMSAAAVERAKRAAAQAGMSLSAYIESLL